MPRRFSRLSGVGRIGLGSTSIAAGIAKIGIGGMSASRGFVAGEGLRVGKGLMAVHSGAKTIRSGARHVRAGIRGARGQKGHPFYGNQYVRVSSRNKARRVR
jgi:hypothetical protein